MELVLHFPTVSVIRRALFAVVAILTAAVVNAAPARDDAMRLLDASGFDAMLREDASRDGALTESLPSFLPPELRAAMVRAIDQSMGYAVMRRSMADELAARFDPAAVDRQLRWWASTSGQAVSKAQVESFRELVGPSGIRVDGGSPSAAAIALSSESPYPALLDKLARMSRQTSECLRMALAFRRICLDTASVDVAFPADVVIAHYSKLPGADIAALRAYLATPGARESAGLLADAYLRARGKAYATAQGALEDALARFARGKIRNESDAGEMLTAVTSRIDQDESLDQVLLLLHSLRKFMPRDPRVLVELARVSIKQGTLNRPYSHGQPRPMDRTYLDDAQSWMNQAIALAPGRADTLVLAGHLAYLKHDFDKSISLLEQARSIGTNNPWLELNLADTLWAYGQSKNEDPALLERAAQELANALKGRLSDGMRRHANHALAHVYAEQRDISRARAQFRILLAGSSGSYRRWAENDYAQFLFLWTDDLDGALAAAREARSLEGFDDEADFYAQLLLVKAERLYAGAQPAEAARHVREARLVAPGLERNFARLAYLPKTLPAIFALKSAGVIGDLSGSNGGLALVYACAHASAADVERLIRARADPNYLHPDEGTPLDRAIMTRNLPALKALLAHGADASMKDHKGLSAVKYAEMVMRRTDPKDVEILASLRNAVKAGSTNEPVGGPLKPGYTYQTLKKISGDRYGHDLAVGTRVVFAEYCTYRDQNLECLKFRHPVTPGAFLDVALEKAQLVTWQEWFKEIGPAAASSK